MKKFLSLFLLVFSTSAFGQTDLSQTGKTEEIKAPMALADAVTQTGDVSVARVLDDEFSILGYSDQARLSILGDVGRENNWNRSVIFKGHSDPKNGARNRGIISWQGSRRKKLDSYLKDRGLLGREDDSELRGMARFMHSELQETFPDVYKELSSAKDTASASEALQKYIKYIPKRPYNSPDLEFKVKKNAVWAKKAKAIGLGKPVDLPKSQTAARDNLAKQPEQIAENTAQKI